jgi:hypothetical protein
MADKGYFWHKRDRIANGTIADFSVSSESLQIAWNEDQRQGLLQATSTDGGSLYDGTYFYRDAPHKIGKTSLRRYEAKDGSMLFFGTYTEHNDEDGVWTVRIEKT